MSTGKSEAKRDAKKQRALIEQQQRETQKSLAEEKDIESRNQRTLKLNKSGRGSLVSQQENLKSLLGASNQMIGSGGGSGGTVTTQGAGGFIDATGVGTSLYPSKSKQDPTTKSGISKKPSPKKQTPTRMGMF